MEITERHPAGIESAYPMLRVDKRHAATNVILSACREYNTQYHRNINIGGAERANVWMLGRCLKCASESASATSVQMTQL